MPLKTPRPAPKGQRKPKPADADAILKLIEEEGKSFSDACKAVGCNKGDSWTYIHNNADLDKRYAHAREARGMMFGENVAAIGMATLAGTYSPDAARVAIDALKWTSARMAPKQYGDKLSVEATVTNKNYLFVVKRADAPDYTK